jgi:predicted nuclease of predicted toxin-antitoxin system
MEPNIEGPLQKKFTVKKEWFTLIITTDIDFHVCLYVLNSKVKIVKLRHSMAV